MDAVMYENNECSQPQPQNQINLGFLESRENSYPKSVSETIESLTP